MTVLSPAALYDPLALAIVGGGTVAAMLLRSPARDLADAVRALARLVRPRRFDAAAALAQVAAFDRIARRHGLGTLERQCVDDADIAAALAALERGSDAAEVATLLAWRRRAAAERAAAAADVWAGAAEAAPAMGMVGTLIGLVAMFRAMSDPAAIGGAMAVALLATLYGALLGNLVLQPIAIRLRRLARDEAIARQRLEAPLAALADINRARVRAAVAA